MSVVSGVILTFTVCEDSTEQPDGSDFFPLLARVNEWLGSQGQLVDTADKSGGPKHPQTVIATGGFNSLDEDEFAKFVLSLDWSYPGNFALLIQPESGPLKIFTLEGESA
jgi:hypothetical protein